MSGVGSIARADAPLEFELEWVAGSLPPPHHFRYTIRGSLPGAGEIVFMPGYGFESAPQWVVALSFGAEQGVALKALLDRHGVPERRWLDPGGTRAVGGSYCQMRFIWEDVNVAVPDRLTGADRAVADELEAAIRALVPDATWLDLRARHAQYKKDAAR